MKAKKDKTPADKEAIRKAVSRLSSLRYVACKMVKEEKTRRRVPLLEIRVAELEAELGALSNP